MRTKELSFTYLNKTYVVHVTIKSQRNIYYRFRNGEFFVSAPYLTSERTILNGLTRFAPKLIKMTNPVNTHYSFDCRYIFLLGKRVELSRIDEPYSDGAFTYFDKKDFDDKLKKYALGFITQRVRKFEEVMGVYPSYKVRVKKMTSRYGSNSRTTHGLSFNLDLIHYSEEIIDSVVIHELAHHFYGGHQNNFYKVVLKYCPNYWELKHKLNKRIHE